MTHRHASRTFTGAGVGRRLRLLPMFFRAVTLLFFVAATCSGGDRKEALRERLLRSRSFRTGSGRFTVVGTNMLENMDLGRWAEAVCSKAERATGVRLASMGDHAFRVIVRAQEEGEDSGVAATRRREGTRTVHSLLIRGYDRVDLEAAEHALCLLLFGADLEGRGAGAATSVPGTSPGVPGWLSIGMARNLRPGQREENAETSISLWQQGKLPSVRAILAGSLSGRENGEAEVLGEFFAWLISLPENGERFSGILDILGRGETLSSDWLARNVGPQGEPADIEELWDRWMLRQRWVVFTSGGRGTVNLRILSQLRAQLLLRSDDYDTALGDEPYRRLAFADLLGRGDESWIPDFARSRSATLRLLAVGREKRFGAVVEAYCRFLDALAQRRRPSDLRGLLNRADRSLDALHEDLEKDANPSRHAERATDGP